MNVEIGAEAALFPEKEYINGIAVAVRYAAIGYIHCFYYRASNDLKWTLHICSLCSTNKEIMPITIFL
jgi:hypothetical protein